MALQEEKVPVTCGKKKASVRKETNAVSGMRVTIMQQNRHRMPPHLPSHPCHEVEVCRGREVSVAKVTMAPFFDNRADAVAPAIADRSEGFLHRAAPPERRTKCRLSLCIFSFFIFLDDTEAGVAKRRVPRGIETTCCRFAAGKAPASSAVPAPVVEYVAHAPSVFFVAPAPVVEYVASATAMYTAPAPVVEVLLWQDVCTVACA